MHRDHVRTLTLRPIPFCSRNRTPRTAGSSGPIDAAALARSDSGARVVESALCEVFPWARHLSDAERAEFTAELIAALADAAEPTIERNPREVLAGWRATARIKADKGHARALAPTEGDFGPAEVTG